MGNASCSVRRHTEAAAITTRDASTQTDLVLVGVQTIPVINAPPIVQEVVVPAAVQEVGVPAAVQEAAVPAAVQGAVVLAVVQENVVPVVQQGETRDVRRCVAMAVTTGRRCRKAAVRGDEYCGIHRRMT
jgi:hypothetical protein